MKNSCTLRRHFKIKKTDCIRYLGTEIDTFDKGDRHIKKAKAKGDFRNCQTKLYWNQLKASLAIYERSAFQSLH
ncbi:hypothetical protein BpHYR1_002408 [Brachionus plicatilis]|uniref:Uncharacterized protein n=1 Tax=Brachionus plicatilis TaxID=10195 RepID=A0A3M7PLG7_BRAPC|nr:hypothetical protein BpHYR1_002408 [Brachionus plicatilis]